MSRLFDRMSPGAERLVLALLVGAGYALYLPIGAYTATLPHHVPARDLDHAIPFVPAAVYVYALLYPLALLPLAVTGGRRRLRRTASAYLAAMGVSYAFFIAWPVHMTIRPEIPPPDSRVEWCLALLYAIDRPSNCFPSLHVSTVLLAALSVRGVDETLAAVAMGLAVAVSASTLLVKQHWLVDVAGGAALAAVLWGTLIRGIEPASGALRRRGLLLLAGLYAGLFVALELVRVTGWSPG